VRYAGRLLGTRELGKCCARDGVQDLGHTDYLYRHHWSARIKWRSGPNSESTLQ
jgi:hypothetical protein